MDIKNALLEIIRDDANRMRGCVLIEKIVLTIMDRYIKDQGKELLYNHISPDKNFRYDGYAPEGFDEYNGETAIDIRIVRMGHISLGAMLYHIERFNRIDSNLKNIIFIIIGETTKEELRCCVDNYRFNIDIWDIDKFVQICEKYRDLFEEVYNNIDAVYLKDTIEAGISRVENQYKKVRESYIDKLHTEYKNDNLALFLGAGVSQSAKIADWKQLINDLFVSLVDKQLEKNGLSIDEESKNEIISEMSKQNNSSPLLQARFLKNGFEKDFYDIIRKILYRNASNKSDLLEELGQLCISDRGKTGIQAIVTYNFDDLMEKNLDRLRIKYCSVSQDAMTPANDELGIYHVHGFLPQKGDIVRNSLIVFSEDGYHKLMLDPYHWANMKQLNYMMNNTCLFVGVSMTDPNMRRLLEVAANKDESGDVRCRHYAILPRFSITSNKSSDVIQKFESINESLQETMYRELGVNVLWVDDFEEVPKIINKIKGD